MMWSRDFWASCSCSQHKINKPIRCKTGVIWWKSVQLLCWKRNNDIKTTRCKAEKPTSGLCGWNNRWADKHCVCHRGFRPHSLQQLRGWTDEILYTSALRVCDRLQLHRKASLIRFPARCLRLQPLQLAVNSLTNSLRFALQLASITAESATSLSPLIVPGFLKLCFFLSS